MRAAFRINVCVWAEYRQNVCVCVRVVMWAECRQTNKPQQGGMPPNKQTIKERSYIFIYIHIYIYRRNAAKLKEQS